MQKFTWIQVLVISSLTSGFAVAEDIAIHRKKAQRVSHAIEKATTYSDRALVTRRAKLSIDKGENWFLVGALSNSIDIASLKLKLQKSSSATIEQVIMERQYEKRILRPEMQKIIDELRIAYGSLLEIRQEHALLRRQHQYLNQVDFNAPFPRESKNEYQRFSASMGALSTALTMLRNEQDQLSTKIQNKNEEIRVVSDRIRTLHNRANQFVQGERHEQVVNIYVKVDGSKNESSQIEFEYMIPNAKWAPVYDIRANLDRNRGRANIELIYSGLINQATGEDWKDIDLTVSTLDPAPLFLPTLNHWKLSENREEHIEVKKKEGANFFGSMAPSSSRSLETQAVPKRKAAKKNAESLAAADFMDDEIAAPEEMEPAAPAMQANLVGKVREKMMKRQRRQGAARARAAEPAVDADAQVSGNFRLQSIEDQFPNFKRLISSVEKAKRTDTKIQGVDLYAFAQTPVQKRSYSSDAPARIAGGRKIEMRSPLSVNLPSNKESQKIPLTVKNLNGSLSYFAIPKQDKRVFLRTKATNNSDVPILRGEANIFMDGSLVSTADLPTVNENSSFFINLGVDENVETKRKVSKNAKDSGMLFKKHITEVVVDLEVVNRHGFAIDLELQDQIPKSPTDEIEVELKDISPEIKDNRHGILTWKLKVPPNKKQKIQFSYLVTHPSNYILSELN